MRVLFVCLGNICRSPMAHAVLRCRTQHLGWTVDSAGTGGWHVGDPSDPRAVAEAEARGYRMADLRARQFSLADFDRFDLILAMDRANLRDILAVQPQPCPATIALFLEHASGARADIPDPYYTGGFDTVLRQIEDGVEALVRQQA